MFCNSFPIAVRRLWDRSIHTRCSHLLLGKSCCTISQKPYRETSLLYLRKRDVVFTSVFFTTFTGAFSVFLATNCLTRSFLLSSTSMVRMMFNFVSPELSPISFSDVCWLTGSLFFTGYSFAGCLASIAVMLRISKSLPQYLIRPWYFWSRNPAEVLQLAPSWSQFPSFLSGGTLSVSSFSIIIMRKLDVFSIRGGRLWSMGFGQSGRVQLMMIIKFIDERK